MTLVKNVVLRWKLKWQFFKMVVHCMSTLEGISPRGIISPTDFARFFIFVFFTKRERKGLDSIPWTDKDTGLELILV